MKWLPTDSVLLNAIYKSWCTCTVNSKSVSKCSLRKEQFSAKCPRDLKDKLIKYHDDPEKKIHTIKKTYEDKTKQ